MERGAHLIFSGLKAGETPLLTTLCQGSADFAEIRQGCGGQLVPCSIPQT